MAKIKLETKTIFHTASKQMQKAEIQLLPNSIKTSFCKKFFTFSKCEKVRKKKKKILFQNVKNGPQQKIATICFPTPIL